MGAGRPLKFQSVEELQGKIENYFNVTPKDEWTITGLALALDTSRETLINYENKDEYFDTIKKSKLIVENGYEIDLKKHGRPGTIFALKNFDWKDKSEIDQTNLHIEADDITDTLDKLAEAERAAAYAEIADASASEVLEIVAKYKK